MVNVAIDNTVIERVQSFNFLGIMLNEALSWKNHIAMVGNKISKVIGILYRLKYVFPESVLFTLYNSLIVSYINYGLLLWGVDCHKLETLQKKALRFMTNSSYVAHTAPLLIRHGLLSVTDMYKLKLLKFYYKLSYDLLPPYFNRFFFGPLNFQKRNGQYIYYIFVYAFETVFTFFVIVVLLTII